MKKLSTQEIKAALLDLDPSWMLDDDFIVRDFKFNNFVEAFSFMTAIAKHAEEINHHPDWFNAYHKLTIKLTTHDLGGLSVKDFDLASRIDETFDSI